MLRRSHHRRRRTQLMRRRASVIIIALCVKQLVNGVVHAPRWTRRSMIFAALAQPLQVLADELPATCVINLANGAVHTASSSSQSCDRHGRVATGSHIQVYAADVHASSPKPLTSFTADFIVPPLPARPLQHQVVYFWPGLKAERPEMEYPVLQPVLQYGMRGPRWTVQSYFVDAKEAVAVTAPAIDAKPGRETPARLEPLHMRVPH